MPKRIRTKSRLPAQIENRGLSATLSYFRFDGNYDFTDRTRTTHKTRSKKEKKVRRMGGTPLGADMERETCFCVMVMKAPYVNQTPFDYFISLGRKEKMGFVMFLFPSLTHSLSQPSKRNLIKMDPMHPPQTNENKACKTLINSKSSKMSKTRFGLSWSENL